MLDDARPVLAHQFDDLEQQHASGRLAMWAFLATEILFFGGLFTVYAVYRASHGEAFALASGRLEVTLGTANTVILIGSSLTTALAVRADQAGRSAARWLAGTLALGTAFLSIKGLEYAHVFREHFVPGPSFHSAGGVPGEELFFGLYFTMTGLHAVHMLVGLGVLLWLLRRGAGPGSATHHGGVELFGLYWHFVDIIWVFLFPLLYLVDRHA